MWGCDPLYTHGAIHNCRLAEELLPEWDVWIYHNETVPAEILNQLTLNNVKLIAIPGIDTSCLNMMWRLYPSMLSEVDAFISRDLDSRLTIRETKLINEWIESPYELHLMRDHAYHRMAIMGGMFGLKRGYLMEIMSSTMQKYIAGDPILSSDEINALKSNNMYQFDEILLQNIIYPISDNRKITHVSAGKLYETDIIIDQPSGNQFIGNKYDPHNSTPIIGYVDGFNK